MNGNRRWNAGWIAVACVCACAAESRATVQSLRSPDGRNEIRLSTEPELTYSVLRDGVALVPPSRLGLAVEGRGAFGGAGAKIVSTDMVTLSGEVPAPIYRKATVSLAANECTVAFEGGWKVILRARNDAVAYRFATELPGVVRVRDETAELKFPAADAAVYAAYEWGGYLGDLLQQSHENVYQKFTPAAIDANREHLVYLPLVVRHAGKTLCVTESDVRDYPGWNLKRGAGDDGTLDALFARAPDPAKIVSNGRHRRVTERFGHIAETAGTRAFPWRVFLLCDGPEKLCESDAVYALAEPCALKGDLSWIRPGKVCWDWWNARNVTGVDFKAGINTPTYRHYVDFAAKHGVEYVIMDEGWSVKLNVMEINPAVDVPGLVAYAADKGVGIILWCSWPQLKDRQREIFGRYAKMGVKGFKIDFMDRDDQEIARFLEETARIAAEYRLVLDFHGIHKPTGLQRTYPNVLNYEGVHGLEQVKWDATKVDLAYAAHLRGKTAYFPWNDLMCFYCRMSAGPMDYTPGAMINYPPSGFRAWGKKPGSLSTRVHQMALVSLYEAPLQMLCDSPTQYGRNPECLRFMAAIPTTWDETVGVAGDMESYAVCARRKGTAWYLSAIGGDAARTLKVKLDFLAEGRWDAEIFEDGPNVDRDAEDWRRRTATVRRGDEIEIALGPFGGGWTARLTPRGFWW